MGDHHGNKWMSALPWVLLGKRVQVQPDLDVSAAQLCFGKSLDLPGQLLSHPGEPLSNIQTKSLLEELYKLSARPALQTSATVEPLDISYTNKATHVYVKVDNPQGLSCRFEGPYQIVSRPSRSTVEVRIGSFVDGRPRLQTYNWQSCKIAHVREGAPEGQRPTLGRKKTSASNEVPDSTEAQTKIPAGIQLPSPAVTPSVTHSVKPAAVTPSVTSSDVTSAAAQSEPSAAPTRRPTRSTRNPHPQYIDALRFFQYDERVKTL